MTPLEDAVVTASSTPSILVGPEVEDAAAFYASASSTPSTSSTHLPTSSASSIATSTRRVKPDADRRVSFLDIVGMPGLPEGTPS